MKKNEISSTIGLNLKVYFGQENITQESLAKKLKTRQSWISRIYNGEFSVRSKIARDICEIANIPFLDSPDIESLFKERKKFLKLNKNYYECLKTIKNLLVMFLVYWK